MERGLFVQPFRKKTAPLFSVSFWVGAFGSPISDVFRGVPSSEGVP